MAQSTATTPRSRIGEPPWEIAEIFPPQGQWSEQEYIDLTNRTNRLIELSDGMIEVLPMPTRTHQRIINFLFRVFYDLLSQNNRGNVFTSGVRVQLWPGKIREPDIVVMLAEHREREGEQFFDGADLVVEIVSSDDPERDLTIKRGEYAQAGIPEYWIVDPRDATLTVLTLGGPSYLEHGRFVRGTIATSPLLPGLQTEVTAMYDFAAR